jgi:hypothetical protein
MLPAVGFDNQASFGAGKIGDVWANRDLSPELEPAEVAIAQMAPKPLFRIRRTPTKLSNIRVSLANRCHCCCVAKKTLTRSPVGESASPARGRGGYSTWVRTNA